MSPNPAFLVQLMTEHTLSFEVGNGYGPVSVQNSGSYLGQGPPTGRLECAGHSCIGYSTFDPLVAYGRPTLDKKAELEFTMSVTRSVCTSGRCYYPGSGLTFAMINVLCPDNKAASVSILDAFGVMANITAVDIDVDNDCENNSFATGIASITKDF